MLSRTSIGTIGWHQLMNDLPRAHKHETGRMRLREVHPSDTVFRSSDRPTDIRQASPAAGRRKSHRPSSLLSCRNRRQSRILNCSGEKGLALLFTASLSALASQPATHATLQTKKKHRHKVETVGSQCLTFPHCSHAHNSSCVSS